MTDQCSVHDYIVKNLDKALNEILTKLEKVHQDLIDEMQTRAEILIRLDHLEKSDAEQWQTISEMRKVVYKSIGIAVALMAVIQIGIQVWKGIVCP